MAEQDRLICLQRRIAEAGRRDHRRLGRELDLFSFPEPLVPACR